MLTEQLITDDELCDEFRNKFRDEFISKEQSLESYKIYIKNKKKLIDKMAVLKLHIISCINPIIQVRKKRTDSMIEHSTLANGLF